MGVVDYDKKIRWIRNGHYVINFIIILFISIIISETTLRICGKFEAREFLERAQYLPLIPWQVPVFCVLLMIIFAISNLVKSKFSLTQPVLIRILCVFDLIIGVSISYYLNLSYKGILLLIIANMILYIKEQRSRIIFIIISLIIYSFFDYDVISIKLNMFSINEYIDFYPDVQRLYIYSIKNVFTSLNEVGFIAFIFMLLQGEISENQAIKKLNSKLEITADELRTANEKLEEYARESEEIAKMKERNRLAREIHDILGHTLTSITMGIEACLAIFPIDVEKAKCQLEKILDTSKKGLLDVRRSVRELKVDTQKDYSLIKSIQNLTEDINECTDTVVKLEIVGEVMKLKNDEKQTIFRIIQESITNSMRHGKAKHIDVNIEFDYYKINIHIVDDGIGCETIKSGFGLTHMQERVDMLKGSIHYEAIKNKGFETKVSIPVRWGDAYD
ncbi:MAG: sensor histidine kinase [Firmicutes bacterium HGW-Firmicutes-1]|jgi:signal transduction histidine kinase|nr:MAG: sensor histidine kinase [Firmicutes bacterium HGW-Firmicutes-1]